MMSSATADRCVACLDMSRHTTDDRDANGVCSRCQVIHRNTYEQLIGLLVANDVHIETREVLGAGRQSDNI